jgi:hypothetical protein
MANALMDWRWRYDSRECSVESARARIYRWTKELHQLQPIIPEEPRVELDADLETLSSMARQSLSSQGIATAEDFLSTKSATMANALRDWRNLWESSECTIKQAKACIYHWKKGCGNDSQTYRANLS